MTARLTAEQFLESRFELPDAGQWSELVEGEPVQLGPPDLEHGNTVLNLSKSLAEYVQNTSRGYACFELGLRIAREPDTVHFPAVSYFLGGERFAEADKLYTDTVPDLIIELNSTPDRRARMSRRVGRWLEWGVRQVWVIDSVERNVSIHTAGATPQRFDEGATAIADPVLPEFSVRVSELFVVPEWWMK
jgi:Uma2 family endonuclease